MKTILILEELAFFILAIIAFYFQSPYAWWLFPVCLLLPDLSMIGYLADNKTGAFVYNLVHHKAVAIITCLAGFYYQQDMILFIGIILFAHSSMDRMFGYGFKYITGFKDTHLGHMGHN